MEFPVKKVNWVDCHRLKDYFKQEYNKDVDVLTLLVEQWDYSHSNGSYVRLDVSKWGPELEYDGEWSDAFGLKLVEEWLTKDIKADIELLLWHQLYQGKIEDGIYYIEIWW